eukprot:CAMPEP_0119557462 /NCGR_PEP_ID=MMETSP1352-20130426/9123_1 /TAXON_ID=265584 /ORGANISM="Stauroneis constricta, Strain CCMP1120" /LENGTH=252 /DNA_ID=CAMNT_0007604571 /DNA_START=41 /DNA_END=796 /DNA_ORIENTATION=+
MKLVPAILTALTFVLLPLTTITASTLRDGCGRTNQRPSHSRSHSQPLTASSSASLALLSPTNIKPTRVAEKATCLALVAGSGSGLHPIVALGVVDRIVSQILEEHEDTLAREAAIHKEDLAFRRLQFEYQQRRDAKQDAKDEARERDEKARYAKQAAKEEAREKVEKARYAKQSAKDDYTFLEAKLGRLSDELERNKKEIKRLRSGFFRRFFQSEADKKELAALLTEKERIEANTAVIHRKHIEILEQFEDM